MIVGLGIPAYRQSINVQAAYAWMQDALTATEMGWRPVPLWVDMHGVARARNVLVQRAEQAGARLLLMMDGDLFPTLPEGGLGHMWQVMSETGAAVVGAACAVRNGDRVNCEPAQPGEVYEGTVGSGYLLLDLFKLRDMPKPWFEYKVAADGIGVECGEDVGFCRLAKAHGHKVVVNYQLQMAHVEQSAIATRVDS